MGGADKWLGEEVLAGWRMAGKAMHQRIAAVRMMPSMWLTEVDRATKPTKAEEVHSAVEVCTVWAECSRQEE